MPRCFVCDREESPRKMVKIAGRPVCKSCARHTDEREIRGLLEFDRSGASDWRFREGVRKRK